MMPSTSHRTPSFRMQRVERMIQKRLAQLIQTELSDPRLQMITISHVDVSKDLSSATVLVTLLNGDVEVQEENVRILNHAAHHLRHCLAKESTWRKCPELRFKYDRAFEKTQRVASLLDEIAKK
jgi:ribosome-binding factor A